MKRLILVALFMGCGDVEPPAPARTAAHPSSVRGRLVAARDRVVVELDAGEPPLDLSPLRRARRLVVVARGDVTELFTQAPQMPALEDLRFRGGRGVNRALRRHPLVRKLSLHDTDATGAGLRRLQALERLSLTGCGPNPDLVSGLTAAPPRSLEISDSCLTLAAARQIPALRGLQELRVLGRGLGDAQLAALRGSSIQKLEVEGKRLTGHELRLLPGLAQLQQVSVCRPPRR